jgi:hypothetical protein
MSPDIMSTVELAAVCGKLQVFFVSLAWRHRAVCVLSGLSVEDVGGCPESAFMCTAGLHPRLLG